MATLDQYREIIERCLSDYATIQYSYGEITNEAVFDRTRDRYLVVSVGWDKRKRIHGSVIHLDLIDGKVWVQRDGTEEGIANNLVRAGIPKEDIVIGFRPADVRPFIEFANAS